MSRKGFLFVQPKRFLSMQKSKEVGGHEIMTGISLSFWDICVKQSNRLHAESKYTLFIQELMG